MMRSRKEWVADFRRHFERLSEHLAVRRGGMLLHPRVSVPEWCAWLESPEGSFKVASVALPRVPLWSSPQLVATRVALALRQQADAVTGAGGHPAAAAIPGQRVWHLAPPARNSLGDLMSRAAAVTRPRPA